MNILLVGSGAREHALARAIKRSPQNPTLFCFGSSNNPGIKPLAADYVVGKLADIKTMVDFAKLNKIDIAVIGPELPLSVGVVDEFQKNNIPTVGPTKQLAKIETSKGFTRDLFREYNIS